MQQDASVGAVQVQALTVPAVACTKPKKRSRVAASGMRFLPMAIMRGGAPSRDSGLSTTKNLCTSLSLCASASPTRGLCSNACHL